MMQELGRIEQEWCEKNCSWVQGYDISFGLCHGHLASDYCFSFYNALGQSLS